MALVAAKVEVAEFRIDESQAKELEKLVEKDKNTEGEESKEETKE